MNLLTLTKRIERARTLPVLVRELDKAVRRSTNSLTDMAIRQAEEAARYRLERMRRRKRQNRKQRKAARALCVAIYDCNQACGGPEEGGWWYDYGSLISIEATFFNRERAYPLARALNDWCDRDNEANDRRPISSVLCDGVLRARIESFPPPQYFPERTPHYE